MDIGSWKYFYLGFIKFSKLRKKYIVLAYSDRITAMLEQKKSKIEIKLYCDKQELRNQNK